MRKEIVPIPVKLYPEALTARNKRYQNLNRVLTTRDGIATVCPDSGYTNVNLDSTRAIINNNVSQEDYDRYFSQGYTVRIYLPCEPIEPRTMGSPEGRPAPRTPFAIICMGRFNEAPYVTQGLIVIDVTPKYKIYNLLKAKLGLYSWGQRSIECLLDKLYTVKMKIEGICNYGIQPDSICNEPVTTHLQFSRYQQNYYLIGDLTQDLHIPDFNVKIQSTIWNANLESDLDTVLNLVTEDFYTLKDEDGFCVTLWRGNKVYCLMRQSEKLAVLFTVVKGQGRMLEMVESSEIINFYAYMPKSWKYDRPRAGSKWDTKEFYSHFRSLEDFQHFEGNRMPVADLWGAEDVLHKIRCTSGYGKHYLGAARVPLLSPLCLVMVATDPFNPITKFRVKSPLGWVSVAMNMISGESKLIKKIEGEMIGIPIEMITLMTVTQIICAQGELEKYKRDLESIDGKSSGINSSRTLPVIIE